MTTHASPALGVEEEFFLVDVHTLQPAPASETVIAHAQKMKMEVVSELTQVQVETNSPPLQSLRELREHVVSTRVMLSAVALSHGVRLLATGVSPVARAEQGRIPISNEPRYWRLAEKYGSLTDSVATCGGHFHVEVPSKAIAVEVCNFVRPWLPTLLAATANSAVHDGVDTKHASWRSIEWGRWPSAGPPPHLHSMNHYDDLVGSMIDNGVVLDEESLYWDVRPSVHQPTVEVRVGDVPAVADEVALCAALVRGLVLTAMRSIDRGENAPAVSDHHLALAYHRARIHGLDGPGVEPITGRPVPATDLLRALIRYIEPALSSTGDSRYVATCLKRLLHRGNGAQRQREMFSRNGDAAAVAASGCSLTISDCNAVTHAVS